ncbi:hypothetical protein K435DRAFT_841368, partial [Dendrothele bispora CBS 962.96]
MDSNDLLSLGKRLSELLVKLNEVDSEDDWQQVAVTARMLADGLRVRDGAVDNHTLLGKTSLPQTLSSLYQLALHGSAIPSSTYAPPITEILRVSANLCPDHDENREFFLDAGLPRALVSLLEAYAETVPSLPPGKPLPLSVLGLKVIRTAVGVLLNASVGYGSWLGASAKDNAEGDEDLVESWTIRSTISGWVWRTLLELKDVKDETLQIFSSVTDALPLLTSALIPFTTHITDVEAAIFPQNSEMFSTLLQADFEVLEESCTQLESLSLDVED